MADDLRVQGRNGHDVELPALTASLAEGHVASAALMNGRRGGRVVTEQTSLVPWQTESWSYFETVPEVSFAVTWIANACSRCRLVAARRMPGDQEPEVLVSGAPADLVGNIARNESGRAQLIAAAAIQLSVPGVGWFIAQDKIGAEDEEDTTLWRVASAEELERRDGPIDPETKRPIPLYTLKTGDGGQDKEPLTGPDVDEDKQALVTRFWRPDPRFNWKPTTVLRSCLGVLRQVVGVAQHVEATIVSRLAGAGLLIMPKEVEFPVSDKNRDADDPFIAELMDLMMTPIQDRNAASAVVPILVRIPGEHVPHVQHLSFATPFDENAKTLSDDAIRRFAGGMDVPAEVILGLGDSNHWTAWQIEESAVTLHIDPMMEAICDALTTGYLLPALEELGAADPDVMVWYDAGELEVRPDRSEATREAYRDGVASWKAYLREIGLDESDYPDPAERKEALILQVIRSLPSSAPALLPALGIHVPGLGTAPLPTEAPVAAPVAPETSPPERAVPERDTTPPDGADGPVAASGADATEYALLAAADGLVTRALERAGTKLGNACRRAGVSDHGCRGDLVHTCIPEEVRLADLDSLLAGAWERVPEVAARYDTDPHALTATLDGYTRSLIAAGWPHEYDRLADHLGV